MCDCTITVVKWLRFFRSTIYYLKSLKYPFLPFFLNSTSYFAKEISLNCISPPNFCLLIQYIIIYLLYTYTHFLLCYVQFRNVYTQKRWSVSFRIWMVLHYCGSEMSTADREKKRERVERNRQTQRNFPILISSGVIEGKPTKHRKSEAYFSVYVVARSMPCLLYPSPSPRD